MKDQIESKLTESIDGVIAFVESSASQAPLVVEELIVWKRAEYTLWALFCVTLFFITVWMLRRQAKSTDDGGAGLLSEVADFVCLAAAAIMAAYYLQLAIQVWLAPRIYVLEYLRDLL